ncbi:MAG TPA: CRTAC1 family protein [Gemmataceae bacterium]|nr:CRTAC1 family protein [Gemmataceae bacterium]
MALATIEACGGRPPAGPPVEFVEAKAGIEFTHRNGATGKFFMTEIMGSGAALFDFDNDGDLDVFLVQSVGESKLFRNELVPGGSLRFTDVTAASGIHFAGYGMGAAVADYNNDGAEDLFVTGYDKRSLYRNNGNGTFTEVPFPQPAGVWSSSASFFDYDRDGRLDLIVLSYVRWSEATNKACHAPTGEPDYCTPRAYAPVSARLYHNDGGDRFRDVTAEAGIDRALGPGLGVAAADLNDDGWPDLFVANDSAQNHVWLNQRNGTFREAGLEAGAAFSEDGLAKAGMGVAIGDADGDGREDLFVLNLMREGATLFRKESVSPAGLPVFVDITRRAGLYTATFPYTGFGVGWIDYDNDGALDLFLANGAVTLREEQRGQPEPFKEKNLLLRNAGEKFTDVTAEAGSAMQLAGIARGAAFGDVDNDGRVDVLVTYNNGPARLLLNRSRAGNWLGVKLEGNAGVNRDGLGARVRVRRSGRPDLVRRVQTDSSYCSASDRRAHFGLGETAPESVEVAWPDGRVERWDRPGVNQTINVVRGSGASK